MNNRLVALSLAMLGATAFLSSAQAQRNGSASARAGRAGTAVLRSRSSSVPLRRTRRSIAGSAFAPYFYPPDYDDYDYGPGIEGPPPPVIVPGPTAQSAYPAPAPKPPESLVIELQGDHWVRVTPYGLPQVAGSSSQPEPERVSNPSPATPSATRRLAQAVKPPSALPPAVLVFRDGHQEEVGKYTIMNATIYVSTDYWTSGSWTRKVQIAELDVPATLKLNQERGANFRLPAGPEEVIVRP
jgi:hypothetical protein